MDISLRVEQILFATEVEVVDDCLLVSLVPRFAARYHFAQPLAQLVIPFIESCEQFPEQPHFRELLLLNEIAGAQGGCGDQRDERALRGCRELDDQYDAEGPTKNGNPTVVLENPLATHDSLRAPGADMVLAAYR